MFNEYSFSLWKKEKQKFSVSISIGNTGIDNKCTFKNDLK